MPWVALDDGQREVDMRIGTELAARGAAAERERIGQAFDRSKIEWLIHALDLIDDLARSRGEDTGTEAQDDLRRLADLLDGGTDG
jgi:hypothetical protein